MLTYRGDPITAFFFSTSGGRTENAENSFVDSGPQPYLVSVRDPYDRISPRHRSELRYSGREMARRLRSRTAGRFLRVQVTKRGVSPRIVRARIVGTKGAAPIDGGKLRTLLDLPDTWASFYKVVSWGGRRRIAGWFEPRRSGRALVERRVRGRWRRAGGVAVSFTGDFSTEVRRRGVYRARAGKITGPGRRGPLGPAGRALNSPTPAAVIAPRTGMAIFEARGGNTRSNRGSGSPIRWPSGASGQSPRLAATSAPSAARPAITQRSRRPRRRVSAHHQTYAIEARNHTAISAWAARQTMTATGRPGLDRVRRRGRTRPKVTQASERRPLLVQTDAEVAHPSPMDADKGYRPASCAISARLLRSDPRSEPRYPLVGLKRFLEGGSVHVGLPPLEALLE